MSLMERTLKLIYPDQCVACTALVDGPHGLCAKCWKDTPFITGLRCKMCSQPLLGDWSDGDAICDDCLANERPWDLGRAALLYEGSARRMILGLKHNDRLDLAKPAARWMVEAAGEVIHRDSVLVPVPIHWRRMLSRRYNQSAELAREIAAITKSMVIPDALRRIRRTAVQDGMSPAERRENVRGAFEATTSLKGREVVVIDDVMTSGATLEEAANACLAAGATRVSVLVLARVAKRP